MLAPRLNILKVHPSTSSIKELGKATVTVCNGDIAELGMEQERKTTLMVYADLPGPRDREKASTINRVLSKFFTENKRRQ